MMCRPATGMGAAIRLLRSLSSPKPAAYSSAIGPPEFEVSAVLGAIYHGVVQWMSGSTGIMSSEKKNHSAVSVYFLHPMAYASSLSPTRSARCTATRCCHRGPRATSAQC